MPKAKPKEQTSISDQLSAISHASPAFLRKVFDGLDDVLKDRVNEILREHRVACFRMGVEMQDYGVMLREAIDIARAEAQNPALREQEAEAYEPRWEYSVYQSPRVGVE